MGYPSGYTLGLFKKEPETAVEREQQETARAAAIGNSFHAVTVACLLHLWLWSAKVRTDPLGAKEIVKRWHAEMKARCCEDFGGFVETSSSPGGPAERELEAEEEEMSRETSCSEKSLPYAFV